ncbi:MAG: response regulator [Kiritimatiellae bacterium]|nr:response regulator [Kiritimatiellia bacterium]
MKRILVVDDEQGPRESLRAIFVPKYEVFLAENAERARRILAEKAVDVVLLDVIMPKEDGLAFLREVRSDYPEIPVIMISAHASVRPVVEAMREGAYDYVTKPFDVEELQRTVSRAIESAALQRRVVSLESDLAREFPVESIVGKAPAFTQVLEDVGKVAKTDATVLIIGESGTGKELIARLLHTLSERKDEPFVAVHCGALPLSLIHI